MTSSDERPPLKKVKMGAEFKRWYWLKKELVSYCKEQGLGTVGQKPELERRIVRLLDAGEIVKPQRKKPESSFDWSREKLVLSTVITDSYRNTKNMRNFMKTNAGDRFKFSNEFMQWMRNNTGKTLKDALAYWIELDRKKRYSGYREKPLPHNEYNQFTRALSEAQPGISTKEMRRLWAIKRSKPGPHVFAPGDECSS